MVVVAVVVEVISLLMPAQACSGWPCLVFVAAVVS